MKTNIEIPVADLKSVLPGLSRIVSKRTSLPVLGCVKVIHSPDHTVRLQANNLDQIVTVRLRNPSPGLPGELLVPLDELTSIAKKCSASDTIELSATDKETVLTYPAAGTRINKPVEHIGVGDFPASTEVNTEPVRLNDAFKQALREALDCVSEDQSRYAINGACLDVSKKEAHYVVGTDGRHMFSANSFLFDVPESIIIPPGKFLTWPGFMEDGAWTLRYQPAVEGKDKVKINSKPAQVRLDSDHWTFVSKPIESIYPNWKQVVPAADVLKSHIALTEPGVKIILEALPLLPGNEDRDQPVSLEVKHDALFLKAKGGGEWTEIPIPAQVTGLPVSISLNRKYLAKALRFGLTQIDIGDKLSALVFRTKGKTMVVMPLRSDDPATMPVNRPTTGQPLSQEATAQSPVPAQENDSATPPTPAAPTTPVQQTAPQPTEPLTERKEMPRTAKTTETTTRGSLTNETQHSGTGTSLPAKSLVDQVEGVKDGLKTVIRDLSALADGLKQAEKDQRASEKEVEAARATLKKLQQVSI